MKANANHLEKKLHSFSAKKFSENFIHPASNGYEDNEPKIENLKKRQGKNFKLHFHIRSTCYFKNWVSLLTLKKYFFGTEMGYILKTTALFWCLFLIGR